MVLTVSFVLSLVTGLSCHHHRRIISANLTPASGRQDHTTSPSVIAHSSVARSRPSHPAPTFVTIGQTPLQARRDARINKGVSTSARSEIFFASRLDILSKS